MRINRTAIAGILGVAIGISAVAGVAACSPDAPSVPTPVTTHVSVPAPVKSPDTTHDGVTQGGGAGATYDATTGLWTYTIAGCKDESDTGCYWDAGIMGNGKGVSFVNLGGHYFYNTEGK